MNLLFVADGRSPIAQNWIRFFTNSEHSVHLVSTYPCQPDLSLASLSIIPVAFSKAAGQPRAEKVHIREGTGASSLNRFLRSIFPSVARTRIRSWLGPLTLPDNARRLNKIITKTDPDLVHAMRIPYEGMLTALADPPAPLLVSIWGNDFTLHASSSPWMSRYTHLTVDRASALHADCRRDIHLAEKWGYNPIKPTIVLPGAGGLQLEIFYPPPEKPSGPAVVVNPRGIRAYVRNDTFFKSIPLVLKSRPEIRFICPGMQGELEAVGWLNELGIARSVQLLPQLSRQKMADLFREAHIAVSITTHDGTPNTLLEAMACGCFPIAGDLESIREWITPPTNGYLIDPGDPKALADAILEALEQTELRRDAAQKNLQMVKERAEYQQVMHTAYQFYQQLTSG
jgi:glycosyltransferase involved in cell wall biosynthesis